MLLIVMPVKLIISMLTLFTLCSSSAVLTGVARWRYDKIAGLLYWYDRLAGLLYCVQCEAAAAFVSIFSSHIVEE